MVVTTASQPNEAECISELGLRSGYSEPVRLSPAERERVFVAVADERRSIASLIDGLTPDQLATESLCAGWDVKTVAAHLISDFADGFWASSLAAFVTAASIVGSTRWPVVGREPQPRRSLRRYVVELIIG